MNKILLKISIIFCLLILPIIAYGDQKEIKDHSKIHNKSAKKIHPRVLSPIKNAPKEETSVTSSGSMWYPDGSVPIPGGSVYSETSTEDASKIKKEVVVSDSVTLKPKEIVIRGKEKNSKAKTLPRTKK